MKNVHIDDETNILLSRVKSDLYIRDPKRTKCSDEEAINAALRAYLDQCQKQK